MAITFGDFRRDAGDFDPAPEQEGERPYGEVLDEMDHERKYQSTLNELTTQRALLHEALITLTHARIFISTREKMHPTGISLYDELIEKIEQTLR